MEEAFVLFVLSFKDALVWFPHQGPHACSVCPVAVQTLALRATGLKAL